MKKVFYCFLLLFTIVFLIGCSNQVHKKVNNISTSSSPEVTKVTVKGQKEKVFEKKEDIRVFTDTIQKGNPRKNIPSELKAPPYFVYFHYSGGRKVEYFLYLGEDGGWIYKNGTNEAYILSSKSVQELNLLLDNTTKRENVQAYINPNEIESITKTGGLPIPSKWKVLYSKKDDVKINKIIALINSGINKRVSTRLEIESLRYGYPNAITIKLKDQSTVYVWRIMKITQKKTSTGTEFTGTIYKDRFLLQIEKNGTEKYFTVYSEDVAKYLLAGSDSDIPHVRK